MAAPTFVADYAYTAARTAAAATIILTCESGDCLVCVASTEDNFYSFSTPTGGTGLAWTVVGPTNNAGYAKVYAWTATASAGNTNATISIARSEICWAAARIYRFTSSDGFAATASTGTTSGTPSLAITTTQANSAVVSEVADWNAVDATTRTWRTINGTAPTAGNGYERGYVRDASYGTALTAYWPDAGGAGSVTTGLTAPASGWKWQAVAVEVKGTVTAAAVPRAGLVAPSPAAVQAATW